MRKYCVYTVVCAVFYIVGVLLLTTGCSTGTPVTEVSGNQRVTSTPSATVETTEAPTKEPVSLEGSWSAEGVKAVVSDGIITVNIIDGDTSWLFWKGTFTSKTGTVLSNGDRDALDSSMMGSTETQKPIKVNETTIEFDFSMMGATKHVIVTKD